MKIVVAYDVATTTSAGRRRHRKVAKACKDYGVRVQFSLFECSLDGGSWAKLRARLLGMIDEEEDSIRFYFVSEDDARKTEHHGVRPPLDLDGPLVF
ncbi:MAG: CRISPR-associated endonuclease Cas2 [Polyangiales bacterium]